MNAGNAESFMTVTDSAAGDDAGALREPAFSMMR